MSDSTFREADRPMRTMKWSSTTRMRMGFEFGIGNSLIFGSNFYCDVCSASECAVDLQTGADGFGAFPHVQHAKVPRGVRLVWTEASSVVAHFQNHSFRAVLQFDLHLGGIGVLDGIGNSFLADAQYIHFNFAGETNWCSTDFDLNPDSVPGGQRTHDLAQRKWQIALFQQIASQIPHRTSGLDHAVTAHFTRSVEGSKCNWRSLAEAIHRQI